MYGLDLVPRHGYIPGHIAVEGHAAADFPQKLARQLIAIGEDEDVRRRCSAFVRSALCMPRKDQRETKRYSQYDAQCSGKS